MILLQNLSSCVKTFIQFELKIQQLEGKKQFGTWGVSQVFEIPKYERFIDSWAKHKVLLSRKS